MEWHLKMRTSANDADNVAFSEMVVTVCMSSVNPQDVLDAACMLQDCIDALVLRSIVNVELLYTKTLTDAHTTAKNGK